MPRSAVTSLNVIIDNTVREIVARTSRTIASSIASLAAAETRKQLAAAAIRSTPGRSARRGRRRPRSHEITKWVADNRARRVPKFVIELTGGLDTKKRIIAKYGSNATFEKGKPLPKPA